MNFTKKFLLISSLILICIGVSGCMKNIGKRLEEEALAYLEEKYDETFHLVSMNERGVDIPYDQLFFYSESHENEIFKVYKGDDSFTDNYYGVLIADDYQAILEDSISTYIPDFKVYFVFPVWSFNNEFTQDTDLYAAMSQNKEQFYATVNLFSHKETKLSESQFQALCQALSDRGLTLSLYYDEIPAEDYATLNKDNYKDYLEEHYDLDPIYKKKIR